MQRLVAIHNAIDPKTGKTYKEGNMKLQHNIPISTLVEVKWSEWLGDGACWKIHARLWVVDHTRDCDGTPLYVVSRWKDPSFEIPGSLYHVLLESQLTPILVTTEVMNGVGALEWGNE